MVDIETLRVIHLSGQRIVLKIAQYQGQATRVEMPLRKIMTDVLRLGSRALVLSHNHPSGDPTPSATDVAVTRQLALMLDGLGVRLHDHVIIGRGRSVSFRQAGLL